MSEEKKAVELQDEDLEKVSGGYTGDNYTKPSFQDGDRVKVRYKHNGSMIESYGTVRGISFSPRIIGPTIKDVFFVTVVLDGDSVGMNIPAGDVEPA